LRRSIDIDLGNDITPGCRYKVKPSKVQTCRHLTQTLLGGTYSQVSGRIWANSARKGRAMRRTKAATFNLPPRTPTSLVEIWSSHDSLSLRQRNPLSRSPWPQEGGSTGGGHRGGGSCFLTLLHWEWQYHILFLSFELVQWGRTLTVPSHVQLLPPGDNAVILRVRLPFLFAAKHCHHTYSDT